MGFYYGDQIFGVKITDKTRVNVLYEIKYDKEITTEEKEKIIKIFNELEQNTTYETPKENDNELYDDDYYNKITKYSNRLFVYLECSCTLDSPPSHDFTWELISFDDFKDYQT